MTDNKHITGYNSRIKNKWYNKYRKFTTEMFKINRFTVYLKE